MNNDKVPAQKFGREEEKSITHEKESNPPTRLEARMLWYPRYMEKCGEAKRGNGRRNRRKVQWTA